MASAVLNLWWCEARPRGQEIGGQGDASDNVAPQPGPIVGSQPEQLGQGGAEPGWESGQAPIGPGRWNHSGYRVATCVTVAPELFSSMDTIAHGNGHR